MDNKIKEYCKDVTDEFVKEYSNKLDENIYNMLQYFGFEKDKESSSEFLNRKGYQLLFDGEQYENYSNKIIYLVDGHQPKACFIIKVLYGDVLSYEVSEIFIYKDED